MKAKTAKFLLEEHSSELTQRSQKMQGEIQEKIHLNNKKNITGIYQDVKYHISCCFLNQHP